MNGGSVERGLSRPMRRVTPFALVALTMVGLLSCSLGKPVIAKTVTIGVPALEQGALIYVADEQKLFVNNGLNVVIKDFDSGVSALNAMLGVEVDIAEAAEFPFVAAAFQEQGLRLIAVNDKFENDYIAARKDRGIASIADLKGKRIGLALKTITEFFLGRFLTLNGMRLQDVTTVDLKPAQFVSAIAGGDVDAVIAWQPYVSRIEKEVNGVVVWPAQSSQAVYSVLLARNGWLAEHPDTAQQFLKSLAQAEDYLVRHPNEAMAIVQKRLDYDPAYIASVWPEHQFSLSLEQTMVVAMKDEAQWMIGNNLTDQSAIPDFSKYIHVDALKAVKPDSVNVLR